MKHLFTILLCLLGSLYISAQTNPPEGVTCGANEFPTTIYSENFDGLTDDLGSFGFSGDVFVSGTNNGFWHIGSGGTGSGGTGPSDDVTVGGEYLYFESSSGSHTPKMVVLPAVSLSNALTDAELCFSIHMYGNQMGDLVMSISTDGGATFTTLNTIMGQQQTADTDAWIPVGVDLTPYIGSNIVIAFTLQNATGGTRSDVAIDNIEVKTLEVRQTLVCNF